jgi:hypothetical protein
VKQAKIRLFLLGFISILSASAAADDGATATFVIDTVRHQGMKCDRVLSLEKAVLNQFQLRALGSSAARTLLTAIQIISNVFYSYRKSRPRR